MEDVLRENIFVMTRDLVKDYHWLCKPPYLEEKVLLSKIEEVFFKLSLKNHIFTSGWYRIKFKDDYEIIFRIVVDGRTDMYGRLIRRYEGAAIKRMNLNVIVTLEKYLSEIQKETNNFGYGFRDSLQTEKSNSGNEKELRENCTIELKNDKIVIKSNILIQFLQNHTYEELLTILQIESNNLNEYKKL